MCDNLFILKDPQTGAKFNCAYVLRAKYVFKLCRSDLHMLISNRVPGLSTEDLEEFTGDSYNIHTTIPSFVNHIQTLS